MFDLNKYHLEITNDLALKLINIFLSIGFGICFIGISLLWLYNYYYYSIFLYKASIIIFRTGILTEVFTIICGIFFVSRSI